jgi:hypothetical protein
MRGSGGGLCGEGKQGSGKTDNDEMRGFFAALRMTNENYVQDNGIKLRRR